MSKEHRDKTGKNVSTNDSFDEYVREAIAVISESHKHTHQGKTFYGRFKIAVPKDSTVYVIGVVPSGYDIHMGTRIVKAVAQVQPIDVTIELYEDTGFTTEGAELLTTFNSNRNSAREATFMIYADPTAGALGLNINRGTDIVAPANTVTTSPSTDEYVMKRGSTSLLEITNNNIATDVVVTLFWLWYEVLLTQIMKEV